MRRNRTVLRNFRTHSKRIMLLAEALDVLDDKLKVCEDFLITLEIGDPLTDE